jgi:hypothetical protein
MLFTCARSVHINTDRKQLKQVLHFRFSFEPRFSEVDKSLFLAPSLRTTSCNVHYSGPTLYDNERETWGKSTPPPSPPPLRQGVGGGADPEPYNNKN